MIKTCQELRTAWINYFKSKGHLHLPSYSLFPHQDPTLLFTSAGMVPFKDYFNGTKAPPHPRIITIQKCLRTTDLESVGKTLRHCTFFEMLGNFSFGDYFKEEAIDWAYDFSINVLKFDPEKIYVTVYEKDKETYLIWKEKIKTPEYKIVKLGKDHNWWGPAGDSGPCGPCTELYLDRGEEICYSETGCKNPSTCKPGNQCDRFLEYWNLVFNQYFQDTKGNLHPLSKKGIDTGAGLERIVALLNRTDSVYETDELLKIKTNIREVITKKFKLNLEKSYSTESALRVITDHIRSVTFAISDGIYPENTGRGYVIRRIIRRALLYANRLGIHQPILYLIHPTVVQIYKMNYPELEENKEKVKEIIFEEEKKFLETVSKGLKKWEEFLLDHKKNKSDIFDGEKAFLLYDTYGFPLELTIELAQKENIKVDLEAFYKKMDEQKIKSKYNQQWKDFVLPADLKITDKKTEFTGYKKFYEKSIIIGIIKDEISQTEISKNPDDSVIIITEKTCFYPEGGGQIGDTGIIQNQKGKFRVFDTRKKGEIIFHIGQMIEGKFDLYDNVELSIDIQRRNLITYHHSATHLLNKALRELLGNSIYQTGSLVADDHLRFDFSYNKKLSKEEIQTIEKKVIEAIIKQGEVKEKFLPIEEAKKTGAIATFGEKYSDIVRIIEMGEQGQLSMELCGGCHVNNTKEIKYFHIIKESSPGAGNRRIEAVANEKVIDYFNEKINEIKIQINDQKQKYKQILKKDLEYSFDLPSSREELAKNFEINPFYSTMLSQKIQGIEQKISEIEKEMKRSLRKSSTNDLNLKETIEEAIHLAIQNAIEIKDFKIFTILTKDLEIPILRNLTDKIKEQNPKAIILCGNNNKNNALLLFTCTKPAIEKGIRCDELIKESLTRVKGKGGGSKDMAQGTTQDVEMLEEAILIAIEKIKTIL